MKFNSLEKTNYSSSYNSLASLETSKSTEPDCETDKKYKRIGEETRNKLLEKIFFDGKKIKKAAKELNINYSSAKTILHLYRKKFKKSSITSSGNHSTAEIKQIPLDKPYQKIEIITSKGGKYEKPAQLFNLDKFQIFNELFLQNSLNVQCLQQQQNQLQAFLFEKKIQPIIISQPINQFQLNMNLA